MLLQSAQVDHLEQVASLVQLPSAAGEHIHNASTPFAAALEAAPVLGLYIFDALLVPADLFFVCRCVSRSMFATMSRVPTSTIGERIFGPLLEVDTCDVEGCCCVQISSGSPGQYEETISTLRRLLSPPDFYSLQPAQERLTDGPECLQDLQQKVLRNMSVVHAIMWQRRKAYYVFDSARGDTDTVTSRIRVSHAPIFVPLC